MNYGEIKKNDIANGLGVRTTLFVSGCTHHCKGCFQPETWNFAFGKQYTKEVEDYYRALTDGYYVVRSLGRELPVEYNEQAAVLKEYREAFADYRKAVTNLQKSQLEFAYKLMGLK
jgi:anaerobic ribonucleoside-triphosphate reductase activating protein